MIQVVRLPVVVWNGMRVVVMLLPTVKFKVGWIGWMQILDFFVWLSIRMVSATAHAAHRHTTATLSPGITSPHFRIPSQDP